MTLMNGLSLYINIGIGLIFIVLYCEAKYEQKDNLQSDLYSKDEDVHTQKIKKRPGAVFDNASDSVNMPGTNHTFLNLSAPVESGMFSTGMKENSESIVSAIRPISARKGVHYPPLLQALSMGKKISDSRMKIPSASTVGELNRSDEASESSEEAANNSEVSNASQVDNSKSVIESSQKLVSPGPTSHPPVSDEMFQSLLGNVSLKNETAGLPSSETIVKQKLNTDNVLNGNKTEHPSNGSTDRKEKEASHIAPDRNDTGEILEVNSMTNSSQPDADEILTSKLPDDMQVVEEKEPVTVNKTSAQETFSKPFTASASDDAKDSSSSIAVIVSVLVVVAICAVIGFLAYKRLNIYWYNRRHYSRLDFLIDGIYDM